MKKSLILCLILLSLLVSFTYADGKRAIKVVPKAQRYALLVGINEYNKPFESLKYCDADMESLEKVLLDLGFPAENIVRLSTSAKEATYLPTKANILRHARLLAEEADEGGMFLVAFSGHGASYGEESYFCPMDSTNKDLSSLVKRSDLYEIVEDCAARQKLVFVDACRNSLVMDGWKSAEGMKGLVDPVGIENPGFFIISSCKTGQFSWEDKKLGHGVFTHFLVEGLRGKAAQDGQISVHSLFSYVNLNTKRYVRLNFEESQIPLLRGNEDELDDFLLATLRTGTTLPASSSKPQPDDTGSGVPAGTRKVLTYDGIDYAFRWCPPGEFTMGSPEDEPGRYDDEKQHKVKITKGFWMLETEVTQAMWESVMGTTLEEQAEKMLHDDTEYKFSSGTKTIRDFWGFSRDQSPSSVLCGQGKTLPMYYVSWNESVEFCRRLSSLLKVDVHLPTEAQWEYACRAGSREALPGGAIEIKGQCNAPALDPLAWYGGNSMRGFSGQSAWNSSTWQETQYPGGLCGVHPVGKKDANAWGLYDMIGNVNEWCSDWYGAEYYVESPTSDPTGPNSGSFRVRRGGSWFNVASYCRSAIRFRSVPGLRANYLGFRPLVVLASKE